MRCVMYCALPFPDLYLQLLSLNSSLLFPLLTLPTLPVDSEVARSARMHPALGRLLATCAPEQGGWRRGKHSTH